MSALKKKIILGSGLIVLLITWLVILLFSVGVIKVPGFEAVQDLFKPMVDKVNYKMYGVISLFAAIGILILYLIVMLVMQHMMVDRNIIYFFNVGVASLVASGIVIGFLLLVLQF